MTVGQRGIGMGVRVGRNQGVNVEGDGQTGSLAVGVELRGWSGDLAVDVEGVRGVGREPRCGRGG